MVLNSHAAMLRATRPACSAARRKIAVGTTTNATHTAPKFDTISCRMRTPSDAFSAARDVIENFRANQAPLCLDVDQFL